MSVSERWARTDEQVVLFHKARIGGSLCGWCGRALDSGETVYIERFRTGEKRLRQNGPVMPWSTVYGPVGIECASPELLTQTEGRTAERCAHCERGVVYRQIRSNRQQPICSRRCAATYQRSGKESQEPAGSV